MYGGKIKSIFFLAIEEFCIQILQCVYVGGGNAEVKQRVDMESCSSQGGGQLSTYICQSIEASQYIDWARRNLVKTISIAY